MISRSGQLHERAACRRPGGLGRRLDPLRPGIVQHLLGHRGFFLQCIGHGPASGPFVGSRFLSLFPWDDFGTAEVPSVYLRNRRRRGFIVCLTASLFTGISRHSPPARAGPALRPARCRDHSPGHRGGPAGGTLPLARLHQLRGLSDAKVLKSLGRSPKGRHYRDDRSRDFAIVPGFDFWRRLSRKLDLQLSKQEQQILLRLGITGQDDHPIVRRG
jgi:hypothetical protein